MEASGKSAAVWGAVGVGAALQKIAVKEPLGEISLETYAYNN